MDWVNRDPEFAKHYARAREVQAETLAEEILDISDTAVCRDSAAAAKVRMDARRWIASHLLPKKWGEKPTEFHAGDVIVHNHIPVERQKQLQDRVKAARERRKTGLSNEHT